MRWIAALSAASLVTLTLVSCRGRSDLVEAELRAKDRELRELRAELQRLRAVSEQYELVMSQPACTVGLAPPVPIHPGLLGLKDITLGRGTVGLDRDGVPGDEGIQVVVVPRDSEDHPIKVPGSLRVVALEITSEGLKLPLTEWNIPPEQLRATWQQGLFSTGYQLQLLWQKLPSSERLRLIVQFRLLDGRQFEAEKDITVRLPRVAGPVVIAPPSPTHAPAPAPSLPAGPLLAPSLPATPATPTAPAPPHHSPGFPTAPLVQPILPAVPDTPQLLHPPRPLP
jgi:hypothetical protein